MEEEEEVEEQEEVQEEEKLPDLRSLNSDNMSCVTFKSRSRRRVDLFWIDFGGKRVKYKTLQAGGEYDVNTFVTHPWIFRDADTGVVLHANGSEVFMPEETDEDTRKIIFIDIPVYKLLDRCIEVYSSENPQTNMTDIEIPKLLKMEVLVHSMNKNIPCEFYHHYEEG